MKRILWIGVAVLVAAVVAVPAWIAFGGDDNGPRRAGALAAPTAAGDVGDLTLVGQVSGTVAVQVRSFDLEVKAPRDIATGQTTGKVLYSPLAVIKPIDATSPALLKMLVGNEPLTSAKLELTTAGGVDAKPGVYLTYDFTGASVRAWRDTTAETISLTYQGVSSKAGAVKPPSSAQAVIGQMTYKGTVVPITAFATGVEAPTDAQTGQLSGRRKYSAVSVTRPVDGIAPTVLADTKGNTPLGQVKIELQRVTGEGKLETYATYTYADALSAAVDDAGAAGQGASQRFDFTFGSIDVSVGGAVASDTWSAPTS